MRARRAAARAAALSPAEASQSELFELPRRLPHGLVYRPQFITRAEEAALLAAIAPLPFREARFQQYVARRRVVHFHADGDVDTDDAYDDGESFSSGPLSPFLVALAAANRRCTFGITRPAFVHALVTEYRPGAPIGWHRDKPAYGVVFGLSLLGTGHDALSSARRARRTQADHRARARAALAVRDAGTDTLAVAALHVAGPGIALLDHAPHPGQRPAGNRRIAFMPPDAAMAPSVAARGAQRFCPLHRLRQNRRIPDGPVAACGRAAAFIGPHAMQAFIVLIVLPVLIGFASGRLFRDTTRATFAATLAAPLAMYACLRELRPDRHLELAGDVAGVAAGNRAGAGDGPALLGAPAPPKAFARPRRLILATAHRINAAGIARLAQ